MTPNVENIHCSAVGPRGSRFGWLARIGKTCFAVLDDITTFTGYAACMMAAVATLPVEALEASSFGRIIGIFASASGDIFAEIVGVRPQWWQVLLASITLRVVVEILRGVVLPKYRGRR